MLSLARTERAQAMRVFRAVYRTTSAGPGGIRYVTVHRRRGGLQIAPR